MDGDGMEVEFGFSNRRRERAMEQPRNLAHRPAGLPLEGRI